MKTKNIINQIYALFIVVFLSSAFLINDQAFSADKAKVKYDKTSKIRITSNRMKAVGKAKYAEFIGNVKTVQGTFSMTSDRLRIYYSDASTKPHKPVKKGSISKVVAIGNVHIKSENFTADSNLALYLTDAMVIILKGADSKITNGENSIVGEKITYYRSDGRIKVEGTPGKRVEGVFYSKKTDKDEYSISPSPKDKEDQLPSEPLKPIIEKEIKD
jgi:lipopolysaccharide transport protein LptA